MGDGYWGRQPPLYPSAPAAKRPRSEYDLPPGVIADQEKLKFYLHDDNRAGLHALKDTTSIGASYDRYLQNSQMPSFGSGEATNFNGGGLSRGVGGRMPDLAGGMHSLPYRDSSIMGGPGSGALSSEMTSNGRGMDFGSHLSLDPVASLARSGPLGRDVPLPPDASSTLFVEGLPRDCTKREVAHIFRPFLGYKEIRLVSKEPKYRDAASVVLCFVDFDSAASAMSAKNALQGYKVDESDPDSAVLRLQFSRFPGPRSGHGSRGKR